MAEAAVAPAEQPVLAAEVGPSGQEEPAAQSQAEMIASEWQELGPKVTAAIDEKIGDRASQQTRPSRISTVIQWRVLPTGEL